MPPAGKVLLGVGGRATEPQPFDQLTGGDHKIYLLTTGWGGDWGKSAEERLRRAEEGNFRWMLHPTTKDGGGGEVTTPRAIARGGSDGFLLRMSAAINESRQVIYMRPMAEMNGHWNPYSAFNANGSRRDAAHSTAAYRNAFRRIALISRGGNVSRINRDLRRNRMPPLATRLAKLPASGRVAMVWNPQGEGSPNVRGNQPRDYYPGRRYVDYVANDLYSIGFKAHWRAQNALYDSFPQHPFMVAEWAPWGTDDPAYADAMFRWVASHKRTVALMYFHGSSSNLFKLDRKRRTLARYRKHVRANRYSCSSCTTFGIAGRDTPPGRDGE